MPEANEFSYLIYAARKVRGGSNSPEQQDQIPEVDQALSAAIAASQPRRFIFSPEDERYMTEVTATLPEGKMTGRAHEASPLPVKFITNQIYENTLAPMEQRADVVSTSIQE